MKTMINNAGFKLILSVILFSAIIAGCNESVQVREHVELTGEEKELDSLKRIAADKVFMSIPSPIETASILKKSGAKYDLEILNPIENKDKYVTLTSKAINLGIYGADLSYTAIFDKSQEAMLYLSCTKKLADDLGIINAFDVNKIERIESNLNNRDSLLVLITDSYWESDSFLKENQRGGISALMVLGGWIEGLHIATSLEKSLRETNANKVMLSRVAEQRIPLESLIELVNIYELDLPEIIKGLYELKAIYDTIEQIEESNAIAVSTEGFTSTTIGKSITINITTDHADQIIA